MATDAKEKRLQLFLFFACVALGAGLLAYLQSQHDWLGALRLRRSHAEVALEKPGAEPRAKLGVKVTSPARPFFMLVQSGRAVVRGPMQAEDSSAPPLLLRLEPTVITRFFSTECVAWAMTQVQVGPIEATNKALQKHADGLRGKRIIACTNERGDLELSLPEPASRQERFFLADIERAFVLQYAIPFPDEAVGVGGAWKVERTLRVAVVPQAKLSLRYEVLEQNEGAVSVLVEGTFAQDTKEASKTEEAVPSDASADKEKAAKKSDVVTDQADVAATDLTGKLRGQMAQLLSERTPVRSDIAIETMMSLAEAHGTEEKEHEHSIKLVYRARHALQAEALGPIDFGDDPLQANQANDDQP